MPQGSFLTLWQATETAWTYGPIPSERSLLQVPACGPEKTSAIVAAKVGLALKAHPAATRGKGLISCLWKVLRANKIPPAIHPASPMPTQQSSENPSVRQFRIPEWHMPCALP